MAAAVGTARVTFPMVVVMITPDIGIEVQLTCYQRFCCYISASGNTTVKPDTRIAERHLRTAANTAADQDIHLQGAQKSCQRTMAAAARIHNLRRNDISIFHIIDFELFGVTEVLKDFSVFVSNCDSHNMISFRFFVHRMDFLLIAISAPVGCAVTATECKIPSLDSQRKSLNQRIGQFFAGSCINLLNRCSGNMHILSALLLRKTFTVNQTNSFILIHIQDNGSQFLAATNRNKTIIIWQTTYFSTFSRSWHRFTSILFAAYAIYTIIVHLPFSYVNGVIDICYKLFYTMCIQGGVPMDFSSYFPIWNKLTPTQQQILERNAVLRKVDKGTVIHNGTVECTGLLLVRSGQLRAYILSDEGREISLYRLFDRDMCLFSASCIMRSIQFEITIEAEKDTELWVIPSEIYKSIMEESAPVANYTNELMASRFSDVMWLMEQIMWKSLDKRVAAFLLEESTIENTSELKITHEIIANHLGSHREVITRMLRYFQSEGMVKLSRGTVTITDEEKLRGLSE